MIPSHPRRLSYWAIALNASAAFLLSNYLLAPGWEVLTFIVAAFTFAAYTLGHRYASTGKELPRKPFLIVMSLYIGLLILPPMSRLKAAIFAYSFARGLMFRAVWLTDRREAYWHLLAYFAVVATAFGHWRADWSLLPFLLLYALTLMLALVLLQRDGEAGSTPANFPWSGLLAGLPLAVLLAVVIFLATPLLPGPHLQFFPDLPRPGSGEDVSAGPGGLSGLLESMSRQPMKANPQGPFLQPAREWLQHMAEAAGELEKMTQELVQAAASALQELLQYSAWLLLLLLLLYLLWRWRQRLWLWLQVHHLDPWRIGRLDRHPRADSPQRIYEAFERLWAYYGHPRAATQAPLEHVAGLQQEYRVLGPLSQQLATFFQDWRYGGQAPATSTAISHYQKLRMALAALHRRQ